MESPTDIKAALTTPAPGDVIEAARAGKQLVSPGRKFDDDLVVLPEVRRTIESLLETAKSGPASSRDEARIKLEKLYTDGPNEGVRDAAEAALLDLGKPAEVVDEPQQATARDGISQPRRVR